MTIKPDQSQRIRELERKLEELSALVRATRPTRSIGSIDQIIRPAKTCAPSTGSYPTTGNAVPIQFLDAEHTGLPSSVTLTARSAGQQAVAATVQGNVPVLGTVVMVVRYAQQWFICPVHVIHFKAPSGGIPGRIGMLEGSATCELFTNNATTGMLELSGISVTVKNWATSAVCSSGDRHGIANWINGRWKAIAEDCGDEGSESSMYTESIFNDVPDDYDDALTPMAGSSGFHPVTVTFHSGVDIDP